MEQIHNHKWDEEDDHNPINLSPSTDSKMVIKLKIPMQQTPESNTNKDKDVIGILNSKQSEDQVKKICLECNKEFSSGKALGGHMRVHVHNKNPNSLKPQKTNNNGDYHQQLITKPYYMNSVNHEGKPTCSQCGKTFPSMKSLFGHMRCHPERVWRGIVPPQTTVPTPVRHRDHVVDLTRFLDQWPVRERRGRKAVKPAEDDVVLLEAVKDLMSLANAAAYGGSRAVMRGEINGRPPEKEEVEDGESDNEQLLINCKVKIKKPKRMKLMELEQNDVVNMVNGGSTHLQQSVNECKYKCTTCNKCFATHQALGGHRSSHNKPKMTSPSRHMIEEHDHKDHKAFVMSVCGENMEKEGVHQCKICDKVFATGQALGGHQRCHWTGAMVGPALSSQITSTGEGSSGRKVLDIDLNEVPIGMMEEDEGGNGNGNGYASSSYNSNIC
ncbi:putative transcription factor C2H2 family [Helianthus anomalus]